MSSVEWKERYTCHSMPRMSKGWQVYPKLCVISGNSHSVLLFGAVRHWNLSTWLIQFPEMVQQYHSTGHLKYVTQFLPPSAKFPHTLKGQLSNSSTEVCEWRALNPWGCQNCEWAKTHPPRLTRKLWVWVKSLLQKDKMQQVWLLRKLTRAFNHSSLKGHIFSTCWC